MVYEPTSGILFTCLLLIFFQSCLSNIQPPPSSTVEINCLVINLEFVDCNWTRSQKQDVNYTFSSAFRPINNSYQECSQYLQENDQTVGCRIPLQALSQFDPFYTNLSIGGELSVTKNYTNLVERVKLNPPFNLSVNWTSRSDLCLSWMNSVGKPRCVEFVVRYRRGSDHWENSLHLQFPSHCIPLVPMGVNYTFQVKSKIGKSCGASSVWSDWSAPLHWSNYTGNISAPSSNSSWQWIALGLIVLIALALLLCYCERVKVLILPVAPDLSKNLQDLFRKHNGNVESWIHLPRELKEGLEQNYIESSCVVCEPSPTLKAKMCDGRMQEHSA